MKVGDYVRVTGGEYEGETGELTMEYEGDENEPKKWYVQFAHMSSEVIEESQLEIYQP